MALIMCPECGRQISDKAEICVGCGFPIRAYTAEKQYEEDSNMEEQGLTSNADNEPVECPYCGEPVSSQDEYCDACGMRLKPYHRQRKQTSQILICPKCKHEIPEKMYFCKRCKEKVVPNPNGSNIGLLGRKNLEISVKYEINLDADTDAEEKIPFTGIYKRGFGGRLVEVYCPRCGSSNCSHTQVPQIIPGKTKTSYTVNLNPLHPFTFAHKKEKVIRKDQTRLVDKIVCNSCGNIFD